MGVNGWIATCQYMPHRELIRSEKHASGAGLRALRVSALIGRSCGKYQQRVQVSWMGAYSTGWHRKSPNTLFPFRFWWIITTSTAWWFSCCTRTIRWSCCCFCHIYIFPFLFVLSVSPRFILYMLISSLRKVYFNGLQLPEGSDFGALHCQPSTNFDRSTKLDLATEPPLLGRCCYAYSLLSISPVNSFMQLFSFSLKQVSNKMFFLCLMSRFLWHRNLNNKANKLLPLISNSYSFCRYSIVSGVGFWKFTDCKKSVFNWCESVKIWFGWFEKL
jgi:hypothetical protein